MKKRNVWIVLIAIIGCMMVQACGEGKTSSSPTTEPDSVQNTTQQNASPIAQEVLSSASQELVTEKPSEIEDSPTELALTAEDVKASQVLSAVEYITVEEYQKTTAQRFRKPLFVNFWATWCGPCIEEMPILVELHAKYGQQIDFLAISCDRFTNSIAQVPLAMQQFNIAFNTRVLQADDQDQAIQAIDEKWKGTLPMTFLFNAEGEKIKTLIGGQSKETFAAAIEEALKK